MSILAETTAKIAPADEKAIAEFRRELASLMSNADSLGELNNILCTYVGATGRSDLPAPEKCTIIACADHGVAAMNVSAYPQKTSLDMTANYLISRGAAANAMANFADSRLVVVDMGIAADTSDLPELINRKIAFGTKNSAEGAAMTRDEAVKSIETGISLANEYIDAGYNVFLPGEMGIANTTASAAICAAMCRISPKEATGRGTNISDERLKKKIGVVERILEVNRPNPDDGIDVLAKTGGFELGCIAGIILGASAKNALVILDGFNTGAAALIACAISPLCRDHLLASHIAAEEGHKHILKKLNLSPFIDLRLRLGEACGSSVIACFLNAAVNIVGALRNNTKSSDDDEDENEDEQFLDDVPETLSDVTFNFYTNTMPSPDGTLIKKCRDRIDKLAKPRFSMGLLEELAAHLAGILNDERPQTEIFFSMLVFCGNKREPTEAEKKITFSFVQEYSDEITIFPLDDNIAPMPAFGCGRALGEDLSFHSPVVGIAVRELGAEDAPGTLARRLKKILTDENGRLIDETDDMLRRLPKDLKGIFSAVIGAIISAAHNSSLIVLDGEATDIIARCTEKLCPQVRPFVLHVQPKLIKTAVSFEGGIVACLGMMIVDAALFMLNDMKTFAETNVTVALDCGEGL